LAKGYSARGGLMPEGAEAPFLEIFAGCRLAATLPRGERGGSKAKGEKRRAQP